MSEHSPVVDKMLPYNLCTSCICVVIITEFCLVQLSAGIRFKLLEPGRHLMIHGEQPSRYAWSILWVRLTLSACFRMTVTDRIYMCIVRWIKMHFLQQESRKKRRETCY